MSTREFKPCELSHLTSLPRICFFNLYQVALKKFHSSGPRCAKKLKYQVAVTDFHFGVFPGVESSEGNLVSAIYCGF